MGIRAATAHEKGRFIFFDRPFYQKTTGHCPNATTHFESLAVSFFLIDIQNRGDS